VLTVEAANLSGDDIALSWASIHMYTLLLLLISFTSNILLIYHIPE
jgi:hypothetical protein